VADASIVRPERLTDVDVLIVRDNAGGIYQGTFGWNSDRSAATHETRYERSQVEDVVNVAVRAATLRKGRLAVVTKPGGLPTISQLWREVALERQGADVELDFVEIDNACFQLLADPRRFDVIVAPNMFGDVLGDTATTLLGSRGLSYSANFGADGRAVFQTAHGAAHDLTNADVANPIAQMRTLAWLLRSQYGLDNAAAVIEGAISAVLARGIRTADIAIQTSTVVGTEEMCRLIGAGILEGEV
jgi:3-isopropylmalate dehydrogenase